MSDWKTQLRDKIAAYAHDSWYYYMKSQGWAYGEERDEKLKTHPHMKPSDELPVDQFSSDQIAASSAIEYLTEKGLLIGQPDFTQGIRDKAVMYSVKERVSQFDTDRFVVSKGEDITHHVSKLVEYFPHILAGQEFNELVDAIVTAYKNQKPVIVFIGGHVIKCGLAPIFIEMIRQGVITHVAMNGAAAIHDLEFAMYGHSSEWVKDLLPEGKWGMWTETGKVMHNAISQAYKTGGGMGGNLASYLWNSSPEYAPYSLLCACLLGEDPGVNPAIGCTIHVSIGCDVIHQHPQACFEHIGATSGRDFYKLVQAISGLNDGGVFINFGSAAMGPEVFSKALNLARNTGNEVRNFTTANFDITELPERLSRAKKNVIDRPHIGSENGQGFNFVGSHEIMIPLLWYAVKGRL